MKTWIQISPYGTFDHPMGKQSISPIDAKNCVKKTKTFLFRLGFKKIPVYIGHPDDPFFQDSYTHMNKNIYGYVKNIRADDHGLWVQINWTADGSELIDNQCYTYLSPRWKMGKMSYEKAYHPEKLISVGLTTTPNLPVQAIYERTPLSHLSSQVQKRSEKVAILQFTQKVQQRMQETGESYPEAWHNVYKNHKIAY